MSAQNEVSARPEGPLPLRCRQGTTACTVGNSSQGRRTFWSNFCIGILVTIATCVASVGTTPVTSPTRVVVAPFVRCFSTVCDLREQYCDEVISSCARCDDDCHPSRITGIESAIRECQDKCQWYYVFTSTPSPATTTSDGQTPAPVVINYWPSADRILFIIGAVSSSFVAVVTTSALVLVIYRRRCCQPSTGKGCNMTTIARESCKPRESEENQAIFNKRSDIRCEFACENNNTSLSPTVSSSLANGDTSLAPLLNSTQSHS